MMVRVLCLNAVMQKNGQLICKVIQRGFGKYIILDS